MPKVLIPLAAEMRALSALLEIKPNSQRTQAVLKLADGILVIAELRPDANRPHKSSLPYFKKFVLKSLIITPDLLEFYEMGHLHYKVSSEVSETLVTCSRTGQISIWSCPDGALLQTKKINTIVAITSIVTTNPVKYALCTTVGGYIIVLDNFTLKIVKTFNMDYYICKIKFQKNLSATRNQFIAITSKLEINVEVFDSEKLTWATIMKINLIDIDPLDPGISLEICKDDPSIFAVVCDNAFMLYRVGLETLSFVERMSINEKNVTSLEFYGSEYVLFSTADHLCLFEIDPISATALDNESENQKMDDMGPPKSVLFRIFRDMNPSIPEERFDLITVQKEENMVTLVTMYVGKAGKDEVVIKSSLSHFEIVRHNGMAYIRDKKMKSVLEGKIKFDSMPLLEPSNKDYEVCFATMLPNNGIVLSYTQGFMACFSLDSIHEYLVDKSKLPRAKFLYAPELEVVSAMYHLVSNNQRLLFTGNTNGTICVWNMEKYKLLDSFHVHSGIVSNFVLISSGEHVGHKERLISISDDNHIVVFDLNPITPLYSIIYSGSSVTKLYWNDTKKLLAVETDSGLVKIWQLTTGYLDRQINYIEAKPILKTFKWFKRCGYFMQENASSHGIMSLKIIKRNNSCNYFFVFLALDLNCLLYKLSQYCKTEVCDDKPQSRRANIVRDAGSSRTKILKAESSESEQYYSKLEDLKTSDSNFNVGQGNDFGVETNKKSVFSNLLKKFYNKMIIGNGAKALDEFMPKDRFKDVEPFERDLIYTYSVFKTEAFILLPDSDLDEDLNYSTCSSITALKIMDIFLSRCVLNALDGIPLQENFNVIVSKVLSKIQSMSENSFEYPCLSSIYPYWFISQGILRSAARYVLKGVINFLSGERINSIVKFYASNIVKSKSKISELGITSTFVLAIIARINTELIFNGEEISLSLLILADCGSTCYRYNIIAIEILGYISAIWAGFIDGNLILNLLLRLSGLKKSSETSTLRRRQIDKMEERESIETIMLHKQKEKLCEEVQDYGFAYKKDNHEASLPSASTSNLSERDNFLGVSPEENEFLISFNPFSPCNKSEFIPAVISSLVYFSLVNSSLIVNSLAESNSGENSIPNRLGRFRLLGIILHHSPLVLSRHIPVIVDTMVKSMDPNSSYSSLEIKNVVAANITEITTIFSNVSFNSQTQKLLVGMQDGTIVIYDIRTATRAQLIEAHLMPVTAVSFSPNGKLAASYSLEENTVRFWQASSEGFLKSIMGALGPNLSKSGNTINENSGNGLSNDGLAGIASTCQLKFFRSFTLGPRLENTHPLAEEVHKIKFRWYSNRGVVLNGANGLELSFSV